MTENRDGIFVRGEEVEARGGEDRVVVKRTGTCEQRDGHSLSFPQSRRGFENFVPRQDYLAFSTGISLRIPSFTLLFLRLSSASFPRTLFQSQPSYSFKLFSH